jgi:hypothetical protein
MRATGLLIATLVLAALLGVLYWSNHAKRDEDAGAKPSPDAPPKMLSLNPSDVTRLTIHHKNQAPVDLSRNASGAWQITAPTTLPADQEDVSTVLSTLSSLTSDRLLEQKASDVAPYGLANPEIELEITLKDSKTQRLLIGDQTPAGNAYYAMLAGDARLFTLAGHNKSSLEKNVSDLRDKRLLTADFDKVSQVELINQRTGKREEIAFARSKDAWQILKPGPGRADLQQVEELIRTLRDAKMELTGADDAKAASIFGSANPSATVKVTGASGIQELEVRKAKDDYYARSSAVSGVYRIAASTATGLGKSPDEFREKKLFDFGYQDPDKIEIHDGPRAYFFTRSGSEWWGPDGKKLDTPTAESLIEKVRSLAAVNFPESGYTTPAFEVTVNSNGGKRVEKVSIAKHGDAYIARRANEPGLYGLSAPAVQELQDSAAKVKPFVAPN